MVASGPRGAVASRHRSGRRIGWVGGRTRWHVSLGAGGCVEEGIDPGRVEPVRRRAGCGFRRDCADCCSEIRLVVWLVGVEVAAVAPVPALRAPHILRGPAAVVFEYLQLQPMTVSVSVELQRLSDWTGGGWVGFSFAGVTVKRERSPPVDECDSFSTRQRLYMHQIEISSTN